MRSMPTIDSTTWWRTPAWCPACRIALTVWRPAKPVPPATAILTTTPLLLASARSYAARSAPTVTEDQLDLAGWPPGSPAQAYDIPWLVVGLGAQQRLHNP